MSDAVATPADIAPLLDEHHLVVLGDTHEELARFGKRLQEHLVQSISGSAVTVIDGGRVRDLDGFCRLLTNALHVDPIEASIDGVVECLRSVPIDLRHHYFIWNDADALLDHDVLLFGRLVNAMLGVAGELEHLSDDTLVIQRAVFLGTDKLGAYAEEDHGQFRSWLVRDDATTRFWDVASCLERPPVLMYRLNG